MQIQSIEIENFRSLRRLAVTLGGDSVFLVSENGVGKSSLLTAIAKALGKDRGIAAADFSDPALPIEISLTLSGFDRADQGVFPRELSFAGPVPTLRIGFRAEWNSAQDEPETAVCGFPDHGWKAASREQRDALKLLWLPATREPAAFLQLASSRGMWAQLMKAINLAPSLQSAAQGISAAQSGLAATPELRAVMADLRSGLAALIPDVGPDAFSFGVRGDGGEKDMLREFELMLSHGGPPLPVRRQSTGLAHLSLSVLAVNVLKGDNKALLVVDEPELSLHPQAQRALAVLLRRLPNQSLIATHSSNILDRADLRAVVRLHGSGGTVQAARPTQLSDAEAIRLARFVNPLTAEGCFARKVVFVEGYSDRIALLHLASRMGRDLDAAGVTVIALDGGAGIGTYLRLFGKRGLGLHLLGLCDEDKETLWLSELQKAGSPATDRKEMQTEGFTVCVKDLEEELITALGTATVEDVIAAEGQAAAFGNFRGQSAHSALSLPEQLRKFLHKENTRLAIPLVDALNLAAVPAPLTELIGRL